MRCLPHEQAWLMAWPARRDPLLHRELAQLSLPSHRKLLGFSWAHDSSRVALTLAQLEGRGVHEYSTAGAKLNTAPSSAPPAGA